VKRVFVDTGAFFAHFIADDTENLRARLAFEQARTQPGAPYHGCGITPFMSVVLHWNGKDVPQELRSLPEGRHVVDAVDTAPELSPDEEAGLDAALESLRQGRGVDASVVFHRIEESLRR
jgi:predicted nucleic acid-binding protein